MSDESLVMAGFQIKFLLLQKAMTSCQIKRKRKQACRFFFSVSDQNSSRKAHSAASAVLHLYYIKICLILKQTACPVMHCKNGFSTALWPLTQKAWQGNYNLAMWESDPQRNCKMRGEREAKKSLCFPGSSVPFIHGYKGNIPSIFRRNRSDILGFEPSSYRNSKTWIFGFSCFTFR